MALECDLHGLRFNSGHATTSDRRRCDCRERETMSVRQRLIIAAFGTIFIITSLLIIAFVLASLKLYRYLIKKG